MQHYTKLLLISLLSYTPFSLAASPAPEKQYQFLIGQWQCTFETFENGEKKNSYPCEWSARYTFNGKMVQDDFTMYQGEKVFFAGTTLRTWVPQKQRWDLAFLSAQGGHYPNFFGNWHGDHMQIQVRNQDPQGEFLSKIRFKDITAESFTWDMYKSRDEGLSWSLDSVIKATRVN